jgi:hypothetical protein
MTLEQLWSRKKARSLFLLGIFLSVFLLTAVRYFLLPKLDSTLSEGLWPAVAKISEDLSTTLIVTTVVAWFLSLLTPPKVISAGVAVIEPRELKSEFASALGTSNSWSFYGGCGRYFRTGVLNEMKQRVARRIGSK